MLKYLATAAILKGFSCSSSTKRLYRKLGNTVGARKRSKGPMPRYYFDRVNRMLNLHREFGAIKDGDKLLELGTGWLHWEAITASLFFDLDSVLFDVWDNRQLDGVKNYLGQLEKMLGDLTVEPVQLARARQLIARLQTAGSFEEIYDRLSCEYVLNAVGKLDQFPDGSFDVVVSAGVLEHVHADSIPQLVKDIARVLKPGGYSIHSINIGDHLSYYDRSVSTKQYLTYSDSTWQRWFQNDVQYINRLQRSDWRDFFSNAGLVLVKEDADCKDITGLRISSSYQKYDQVDLQCADLELLHRKPR